MMASPRWYFLCCARIRSPARCLCSLAPGGSAEAFVLGWHRSGDGQAAGGRNLHLARHQGRGDSAEARQGRLRRQPAAIRERRQTRRGTGRQPERRVVAQRVCVVMVAPALRGQQHAGADQRGEIVGDVDLAARILQPRHHPRHDAAAFQNLAQHHRAGVASEPIGPAYDPKRAVETGRDRL